EIDEVAEYRIVESPPPVGVDRPRIDRTYPALTHRKHRWPVVGADGTAGEGKSPQGREHAQPAWREQGHDVGPAASRRAAWRASVTFTATMMGTAATNSSATEANAVLKATTDPCRPRVPASKARAAAAAGPGSIPRATSKAEYSAMRSASPCDPGVSTAPRAVRLRAA